MRRGLEDYARAGWFSPAEVQMLTTSAGHRSGRQWAATKGLHASAAMNAFQKGATKLAQLHQQAVDSHGLDELSVKETELLDRISQAYRSFLGTGQEAVAVG